MYKYMQERLTTMSASSHAKEKRMITVNQPQGGDAALKVRYSLGGLGATAARGEEDVYPRVAGLPLDLSEFAFLKDRAKYVSGTERFHDVLRTFPSVDGTPPGFRLEVEVKADGLLEVDLVRDIGYGRNGAKRPTGTIFSADSANPYEVAPVAGLLGNLTCNPGIVYDLFINNPKANVDHRFNTLEEVMTELGRALGPGCDVSVELENPFDPDFDNILREIEPYEKILSPYRLVVKVPHTGPVNGKNVNELLTGTGRLSASYMTPATADAFWSHNLALRLREHGYRINYTLMFEPYQTALALQARPYFINTFLRHRLVQTRRIARLLSAYKESGEISYLSDLREYLVDTDHLPCAESMELADVLQYGENLLRYRHADDAEGSDGLDNLRHQLRLLKQCNLPDTRVIVCSMEGPNNYPDIDKLVTDPEFADVIDRLVITAEPSYLARFTSSNHVVSYQRRFMAAAATASRG